MHPVEIVHERRDAPTSNKQPAQKRFRRHCRSGVAQVAPLQEVFTVHVVAAQGLSYQETEGDEVEDMLQLNAHVHHCRAFTMIKAAAQGLSYRETEGDEVEDMLQLIAHVQRRHSELQAVSSGAIASDYQRLRVEHVSFPHRQAPHCSCHPAQACSPALASLQLQSPQH